MDVPTFCKYYYGISRLPIYFYDAAGTLAFSLPQGQSTAFPADSVLSHFRHRQTPIGYIPSGFESFYGFVRLSGEKGSVIIGPAATDPYDNAALHSICRTFKISADRRRETEQFFLRIPPMGIHDLLRHLAFLYYAFNEEEPSVLEMETDDSFSRNDLHPHMENDFFWNLTETAKDNMYLVGKQIQDYIRQGDVENLKKYMYQDKEGTVGKVADNDLRQWKNIFIYSTALALQAAIDGGLAPEYAYSISDLYTRQAEHLSSVEDVMDLNRQMRLEYAERVSMLKYPLNIDNSIRQSIDYVRTHTNQPITTTHVAQYVGYSRSYLSTLFKKQLGFGLKEFILRTKLEKSKELLTYTPKSISEVSSCLCFSSQSHFQKAFREQFGITPQAFRRMDCFTGTGIHWKGGPSQ